MRSGAGWRGRYDVVIAGASFAGLATALQLRGRVLVVDHRPVGAGQTSACGTTLSALTALGAGHTVQQVHRDLVLHLTPGQGPAQRAGSSPPPDLRRTTRTGESVSSAALTRRHPLPPARRLRYRLPYAFCTFDYSALCRTLAGRAAGRGVTFARARATGWADGALLTDRGPIEAGLVVDATGWRAAVASAIDRTYVRRERLSCGLEAELPQPVGNRAQGLHFWAGQGTVWPGYAWSFPCGATSRLGVIAYPERGGATSKALREVLDAFLDGPGADYWSADGTRAWRPASDSLTRGSPTQESPTRGRHLHGGFLPCAPRRPVVGPVLVVGDAAGQCLGLTGEGIRPALTFAVRCGQLLQEALDGKRSPAEARAAYGRYVTLRLPYLRLMGALQGAMSRMSDEGLLRACVSAYPGVVFRFLMGQYRLPADPAPLLN